MPSEFKIMAALAEPEPPSPAVNVIPHDGNEAVARPAAEEHRRNPWTGRCYRCRAPYPCQDRRDAATKPQRAAQPHRRPAVLSVLTIAGTVLLGLLLVAVGVAGLVR